MSRHAPIYVTSSEEDPMEDSEEEPMEDSSHSHASSGVADHPRAMSDDTYIPPPTRPVVTPTAIPPPTTRSQFHLGETSTRPPVRRTARICVRDFPRGPLASRDKEPMAEERDIACEEQTRQRMPAMAHLEWMTPVLRRWRSLEGLPSTFEFGDSSCPPAPLPTTGEPVELTLPTVVAVVRTLFRMMYGRGAHLMGLQSEFSRMEDAMDNMHERYHSLFVHMVSARETAETARARVSVLEGRMRSAGLVVVVCVVMAVLRAAVGFFLPRFF